MEGMRPGPGAREEGRHKSVRARRKPDFVSPANAQGSISGMRASPCIPRRCTCVRAGKRGSWSANPAKFALESLNSRSVRLAQGLGEQLDLDCTDVGGQRLQSCLATAYGGQVCDDRR